MYIQLQEPIVESKLVTTYLVISCVGYVIDELLCHLYEIVDRQQCQKKGLRHNVGFMSEFNKYVRGWLLHIR